MKESTMIFVDGSKRSFRCDNKDDDGYVCGCNVFHRPKQNDPNVFECNSCGVWYRGESDDPPTPRPTDDE